MGANPNFDDMVTTTLRNRDGKLADNCTKTMVLLDRLRRKGKMKPAAGGRTIVQGIEAALNPNGGWYAGWDLLNTNSFEPFTAAEYDWKQAYVPVAWNGLEKLKNMGEWEVIDLISSRVANGEKSLSDLVAQAAYSDGTGSGGKQMQGLQLHIVTTPTTGTVGGIDRATNTFWRNQTQSVTFSGTTFNATVANPSQFIHSLNALAISCTRGSDKPDIYVADAIGYTAYLESLQGIQRINNPDLAAAGFTNLKYYGVGSNADFVLDNGYCPTSTVYALNTDYIYLRVHPDRNFVSFGGERQPVNQDGTVKMLGFAGNICPSNMALQGILNSK
jgi:hypothetical protein